MLLFKFANVFVFYYTHYHVIHSSARLKINILLTSPMHLVANRITPMNGLMNGVLASLSLEQHPDTTFIGRLYHGFDFLGIQFTATGETSPSAVSLARRKEKTARLYEQGAHSALSSAEIKERIEQYRQNWLRYLRGILGKNHPATKQISHNGCHSTPLPLHHPSRSFPIHSHRHRQTMPGTNKIIIEYNHEKTKQTRILPRRDRWGRLCIISS